MPSDGRMTTEAVGIDFTAHVLLWGLRAHVVGRDQCPLVRRRFHELCGDRADELVGALLLVVRLLALKSQRRIKVHLPGCAAISGDEMMLLAAVADAQDRCGALPGPAQSWMARLTGGVFDPSLERSVGDLAALLSRSGRKLDRIGRWPHSPSEPPERPTLH